MENQGKNKENHEQNTSSRDFGWIEFGKQKVRTCLVYVDVC